MMDLIFAALGAASNRIRGGGLDPLMDKHLPARIPANLLNLFLFFLVALVVPNFVLVGQDPATGVPVYELEADLLSAICLSIWMLIGQAPGFQPLAFISGAKHTYQPKGNAFDRLALLLMAHEQNERLACWVAAAARGGFWGLGFSILLFDPAPLAAGLLMPVVYWLVFNTYGKVKLKSAWAVSEMAFGFLLWYAIAGAM